MQIPSRYQRVEDLWLSYVVHMIGWNVRRIKLANVDFMEDGHRSSQEAAHLVQDTAQWRQLKELKNEMLEDLRSCGWNV